MRLDTRQMPNGAAAATIPATRSIHSLHEHGDAVHTSLAVDLGNLCCPYADHGRLVHVSDLQLQCESCERVFPVAGNRPILLDESRSIFSAAHVTKGADQRQFPENTGWRFRLRRMFPLATSRDAANDLLSPTIAQLAGTPAVLVIGCGDTGSRYAHAFGPAVRLFLTDVTLQGDAVIACDGACLPFPDEWFDCIIVDQVLEHAAHPARIVDEVSRCLKPHGIVYSGVPFLMPVHGYPYDFQRYTPLGHRLLYTRFEEIDFRVTQGPFSAASLTLVGLCASLWDNVWWSRMTSLMTRIVLGPLLRFDRRFCRRRQLQVPAASLFIGRKLPVELTAAEIIREWTNATHRARTSPVS